MIGAVLQQTVSGLAIGSVYALVAIAFSLTVRALNQINFATGELFMLGAYAGIACTVSFGLPFWAVVLATAAVVSIVGVLFEKFAYRPIFKANANDPARLHILIICSTIGTGIFLQNSAMLIWGAQALPFPKVFEQSPVSLLGAVVPTEYFWIMAVGVALMTSLSLFLQRSWIGMGMRAAAMDREAAALMGVKLAAVDSWAFGLSAGVGAVGGLLIGATSFAYPTMGAGYALKGFTAAVIGGLGSLRGALLGGLLLGLAESLVIGFISSLYKDVVAFALLLLFLQFKPSGLLLKPVQRRV
jgi:branched-chain amino acid transport system permease protein